MNRPIWRCRAAVAFLLAGGLAVLVPAFGTAACNAEASAHATLQRSVPVDGARLDAAPRQVDLFFGQQLVQNRTGTFAVVLNDSGATVSDEAQLDPRDGTHLEVPLHSSLDAGRYTVFWKTTSDEDGGVTLGSFSFAIGQPAASATVPGGQVLVPDDLRPRALSSPAPAGAGNGTLVIGIAAGAAAGLTLGGIGVYLLRGRGSRSVNLSGRAARGRRH